MNEFYNDFLYHVLNAVIYVVDKIADLIPDFIPGFIEEPLQQVGEAFLPTLNSLPESLENFLALF